MKHRVLFALALAASIYFFLAAGSTVPSYFRAGYFTPPTLDHARVQTELGEHLSSTTTFASPQNPEFPDATSRWSNWGEPTVQLVITPGEEADVSAIVKYCVKNGIEFLAYNRGYAFTSTFKSFNGVLISLVNLNRITIQPDGKSAWFQGGTDVSQVVNHLWDRGFITTTGSAQCVSLLGPGLGGGYGDQQGAHGMISDNFLQLNVALADGSAIRVNSTCHEDLFWGLKGAGHNFGIVTSVEMNIFPRESEFWYYHNYIWRGDKLVDVFNAVNDLSTNGSLPVNMAVNYGTFMMNTTITDKEPVILWTFLYSGPTEEALPYMAKFDAIGAAWDEKGQLPYPDIPVARFNSLNATLCQKFDVDKMITTAGLQVYNITTELEIWKRFQQRIDSDPELAASAFMVHEGYSNQAVLSVDPDDSAYPFRDDYHLMMFQGILAPNSSKKHDMWEWAREVKDLWNAGQPGRKPDAYVNYANGYEGPEQWYGYEPWRLEKLRRLKAKYDPKNRFRFFNPIIN
ncbi:hypothetical protein FGRMN_10019 [Fusarium graminum]|nr:hypothetical protein FGRMN_10019 [Fusarium graminum]